MTVIYAILTIISLATQTDLRGILGTMTANNATLGAIHAQVMTNGDASHVTTHALTSMSVAQHDLKTVVMASYLETMSAMTVIMKSMMVDPRIVSWKQGLSEFQKLAFKASVSHYFAHFST